MKNNLKRIICALFCLCVIIGAFSGCADKNTKQNGDTNTTSSTVSNADNSSNTNSTVSSEPDSSVVGNTSNTNSTSDPANSSSAGSNVTSSSTNSGSNITGSNTSSGVGPNTSSGNTYPSSDPYENIPVTSKGKTVRFATWENVSSYDFNKFYRDTGIHAEVYHVRQSSYVSTIRTKIAAGDIPDVFVDNDGGGFPITLSIAQPINKCSSVDLSDIIWDQSLMATATIGGNVFLVNTVNSPWTGANLVYYNKALFRELGEKTPEEYYKEGNWTWDTMENMLKRFVAMGYVGANVNPRMFVGSAGASFLKWDYTNGRFVNTTSDPALTNAYKTWARWNSYGLLGAEMTMFEEGRAAMYCVGVNGLKSDGHWKYMDPNDLGFCYFPSEKPGQKAKVHAIYRMYGIVRGAPNADAAGYFIRHFLDSSNYNMNTTFHSSRAKEFYYEIINTPAQDKYFTFDGHCAYLAGYTEYEFNNAVGTPDPNDVYNRIQSVSNMVNNACAAGNYEIEKIRERYK